MLRRTLSAPDGDDEFLKLNSLYNPSQAPLVESPSVGAQNLNSNICIVVACCFARVTGWWKCTSQLANFISSLHGLGWFTDRCIENMMSQSLLSHSLYCYLDTTFPPILLLARAFDRIEVLKPSPMWTVLFTLKLPYSMRMNDRPLARPQMRSSSSFRYRELFDRFNTLRITVGVVAKDSIWLHSECAQPGSTESTAGSE